MSELVQNFADLGDVGLHYVSARHGPLVVLLHGWPQTSYMWRDVRAVTSPRWSNPNCWLERCRRSSGRCGNPEIGLTRKANGDAFRANQRQREYKGRQ